MTLKWERVPAAKYDVLVLPSDWDGVLPDDFEKDDKVLVERKLSDIDLKPGMCIVLFPDGRCGVFDDRESFEEFID